jgi:D-alanine--poly(phosphoribitol) ligase subunit 2
LIYSPRSTRNTPMTDDAMLQREIASLLFHNLNVEVSSVHDDLIENGLLDSLKIVELLMELENRFLLKIPLEDLEVEIFRSVASIARLMAHLCAPTGLVNTAAVAASSGAMRLPVAD